MLRPCVSDETRHEARREARREARHDASRDASHVARHVARHVASHVASHVARHVARFSESAVQVEFTSSPSLQASHGNLAKKCLFSRMFSRQSRNA